MKTFMTARQSGRFRIINLEHIAYVDFTSLDGKPDMPEKATIHFVNSDKALMLDQVGDVTALLAILQGQSSI